MTRTTWLVDRAGNLAELEQRLNRLTEQGFRIRLVLAVPRLPLLLLPTFIILATWPVEPVASGDGRERSPK